MYLIRHFILFLIFFPGAIAQPNTGDSIQPNRIVTDQKVNDAFQDGEWFRFRMRYGFLNASYATATVRETTFKDQAVYHVAATGKTTTCTSTRACLCCGLCVCVDVTCAAAGRRSLFRFGNWMEPTKEVPLDFGDL